MSQYYLFRDTRKCIGCNSCEVQCKANKNLPAGPRLCQIIEVGPRDIGGQIEEKHRGEEKMNEKVDLSSENQNSLVPSTEMANSKSDIE